LALLLSAALLLRLWSLNDAPPWLWWDEASQGLDARDLIEGHFRVFFARAEGKEPLYVYLTVPFVAAFDGEPFAARLAGALTGVAMVPGLYAAGRALWRDQPRAGAWAGAFAAALWTTNFWPQSINRIGFQVNTLPLILTLGVVAWLNWTHRPVRSRALFFGFLAGLVLYTYLAARITPLLWLALFATLPAAQRKALRPTVKWALLAFALAAAPLLLHFALHPEEAIRRVGGFTAFYEAPDTGDRATLLLDSFVQVAGGFLGFAGDPIPRHNIPNRPPFSLPLAVLFASGLLLALPGLVRRSARSWTLLLWLGILALPAFLSANSNPHFPRLLGALPAAFLFASWPAAASAEALTTRLNLRANRFSDFLALAFALLIAFETVRNIPAYFITWARDPALYSWFQGDLWHMANRITQPPRDLGVVAIDPSSAYTLDYAFQDAGIAHTQVEPATLEGWLQRTAGSHAGEVVSTPVWEVEPYIYADTQHAIPFYLAREGILTDENHEPGYVLLDYRLGERPSFAAPGRRTGVRSGFGPGLALTGARWGAAHPNIDRDAASAAAGTNLWAILEWRLDAPLPGVRAAVDLVDAAGRRLATVEQPLMVEDAPLIQLPPDGILRTYHLVEVPAAQPPGALRLEARAYDAATGEARIPDAPSPRDSIVLDAVQVTPPLDGSSASAEIAVPLEATLGPDLLLLGRDAWPETTAPGQDVTFRIYYEVGAPLDSDRTLELALAGAPAATVTLSAAAVPGQITQAYVDLRVPTEAPPGNHVVTLNGPGLDAPVELGTLAVAGPPTVFEPPGLSQRIEGRFDGAVALLGAADTPALITVSPGETVTVTLVWRALAAPDGELVRFVHVLGPDGRPVAQQDSIPCGGSCPALSWRPGEILIDAVRIEIPDGVPPGEYPLAVGWYAADSGVRLTADDATRAQAENDALQLPIRIVVTRAETAL
jgi:hypothetical protein